MNAVPDEVLAGNSSLCGIPKADSFILLRDPLNSDMPWPGFLFGQTTASIWYWCADQVIILYIIVCVDIATNLFQLLKQYL